MKKNLLKLLALVAVVSVLPLSCNKPEPEPKDDPGKIVVPEEQDVNLAVNPAGGTVELEITATDAWTVEKDENYKWISVSKESGEAGTETLVFTAEANTGNRERSAMFYVMQGKSTIYSVFISQKKYEIPLGEGDYNFLKAIVDGNMFGADTPRITDWYSFDPSAEGFGFPGIDLTNVDGKWYIVQILLDDSSQPRMVDFPKEMVLLQCQKIRLNNQEDLKGVEIPTVWNTPKLAHIALSHTKMTGVIPQGLADDPCLSELYFDDTDFYGALPHVWATKVLEVCLMGSTSNTTFKGDDPYDGDNQCPYLGYMVPATLDVILNTERSAQTDKTQMKLGGVKEGHWLGFEEGWGQTRYEKFDPAAEKGNKSVWSNWRLLIGNTEADPDVWAYYFSNMGYDINQYKTYIPQQMMVWDQKVADAFTAEAKVCHAAKLPIDMTKFGKVVEEKPDDDIASGNVITVGDDFWK